MSHSTMVSISFETASHQRMRLQQCTIFYRCWLNHCLIASKNTGLKSCLQFAVQSRKLLFGVAVIISVSTVSVEVLQQPVQDLLGNIGIRGIEVLRHDLNTLESPNRPYVFNVSVVVCFRKV